MCAHARADPGGFHFEIDGEAVRFRCEGYATTLVSEPKRAIVLQIRRRDKQDTFMLLGQKIEELNVEVLRRRQSEKELAAVQGRLNAILDQMPAGVMIAEAPSGKIVYSNLQAQNIFGGAISADSTGRYATAFTAWHADGRPYAPEDFPLMRALLGEVVLGQEFCFQRADGTQSTVRANAAPIRDENGGIVAAVTTYYEINEQKRLEQATLIARAEAEMASRAKDEFLAMLGHELRNPLAPILTALHLMRLRGVGAEKERSIIERQVKHLVRLVDDLLDVSRITSGKIELKKERVELGAVVAKAIEIASPLLEKRDIELALSVPAHGLMLESDPERLAQVVSNLLTNAAKYSERRGMVWVTGQQENDHVVLRVRDAGIGIAPDMLPRIFDWFVQEKQALDRSQGGLGLGLAIVRSLVTLHGGTVEVHSAGKGHGSEFTVRLPLALPRHAALSGEADSAPSSLQTIPALRVLVVDDNVDAAQLLAEVLQSMGHASRVAHDGPGALHIVKDFAPQLALLDIGLPVMDGFELAERLRREPGLREIQLVAITGYGRESDRKRSWAAGFDAHLVKPVDLTKLDSLLRELARKPRVAHS